MISSRHTAHRPRASAAALARPADRRLPGSPLALALFVLLLVVLLGALAIAGLRRAESATAAALADYAARREAQVLATEARAAFDLRRHAWQTLLLGAHDDLALAARRADLESADTRTRLALEKLASSLAPGGSLPSPPASIAPAADLPTEHARLVEATRSALDSLSPAADPRRAASALAGADHRLDQALDALVFSLRQEAAASLATTRADTASRFTALLRVLWIVAPLALLASLALVWRSRLAR